jgi:hypothetical protein
MNRKLLLLFACTLLATTSFAQLSGENLTWTFDQSTGTLTIGGEGEMNWPVNSPWGEYTFEITNIIIEDGL